MSLSFFHLIFSILLFSCPVPFLPHSLSFPTSYLFCYLCCFLVSLSFCLIHTVPLFLLPPVLFWVLLSIFVAFHLSFFVLPFYFVPSCLYYLSYAKCSSLCSAFLLMFDLQRDDLAAL